MESFRISLERVGLAASNRYPVSDGLDRRSLTACATSSHTPPEGAAALGSCGPRSRLANFFHDPSLEMLLVFVFVARRLHLAGVSSPTRVLALEGVQSRVDSLHLDCFGTE